MAEVQLKNVYKKYEDGHTAVSGANIEISDKEFVVLVGPSGCGKTTTLRMIAGLEDITGGELLIDKKLCNNVEPKDRDIAMVFQNYALYPHMSVYENMAFGLKLRKMDKKEIDSRVKEAARILDLEQYLSKKPAALSGGQRQRVAVGRAIVRKPKVFLFDEPLSNLDAKLRVQMRTEISRLHKELNATTIYVTHDQTEAMTMGDKIVVMSKGVIQQTDTPLNLYNNPVNKFVAGFIGSPAMNFIEGVISYAGSTSIFTASDGSFTSGELLSGYEPGEYTFGIRPEDFSLTEIPGSHRISVTLELVEPMGNETFIYFIAAGVQFTARVNPDENLKRGEQISLWMKKGKYYFFRQSDGARVIS
ncbi:MAG: sn-glycerol-3-phosphate ABC transporter ATP-binding protein UgpC [Ignavibacteriaceae bacterium]|nr:sn-glycerol-3-phosphate ABC transporter ATP-binding protein UgpC [Ignavibacteriaceae bacterium]